MSEWTHWTNGRKSEDIGEKSCKAGDKVREMRRDVEKEVREAFCMSDDPCISNRGLIAIT